jgi:hypothetical protein
VQSFGNLAPSAIAGLLWTAVSPRMAFWYLVAWMVVALVAQLAIPRAIILRLRCRSRSTRWRHRRILVRFTP